MQYNTILALMVDPVIRGGGPKRYLRHLRLLADRGIKITILMNKSIITDGAFKAARVSGHKNIFIEMITEQAMRPIGGWALFFRRSIIRQRKRLTNYHPDAIFAYGSCNLLAAAALKRIYRVPFLFDPRDNPVTELGIIIAHERSLAMRMLYRIRRVKEQYFERVMARVVNYYFFQTEFEAEEYQRRIGFSVRQYSVLPNSVRDGSAALPSGGATDGVGTAAVGSTESAAPLSRVSNDNRRRAALRTILFCGALIPRKAALTLVQAVDLLAQEGLEVRLRIAGRGAAESEIRDYIHERQIANIELLGWVDTPRMLMSAADLLVVPSLYDALPDVLLEAFAVGIAVIGSDVAGIRIAINDERFLFQSGSAVAIADKIRMLHKNPELFRAAQKHARERYQQYDFDWAERFITHIKGV